MGREAVTQVEAGCEAGEVRALLESTELILRGDVRRRFSRSRLEAVRVEGGVLRFACDGEDVRLHLGEHAARAWAEAIARPPPSLRSKLGLEPSKRAFLVGTCDDDALAEALQGVLVADIAQAALLVARIDGPGDLAAAQAAHANRPSLPLWVVHPKGKGVAFGDGAIRAVLREAGFIDTKSCAVSDRLTASRYGLR